MVVDGLEENDAIFGYLLRCLLAYVIEYVVILPGLCVHMIWLCCCKLIVDTLTKYCNLFD